MDRELLAAMIFDDRVVAEDNVAVFGEPGIELDFVNVVLQGFLEARQRIFGGEAFSTPVAYNFHTLLVYNICDLRGQNHA